MSDESTARPATGKAEFAAGWPVIIGALLCYAVSIAAIPAYTNGVFMTEMTKEFGWTRGQFTSAYLAHTIVLAPMAPIIGIVADRWGVRLPIAISLVGMAVCYILKATVMNSFAFLVVLTGAAAFIGAASLPVVFTRAVNSWFDKSRGLALGCTLTGTGITASAGPVIVAWLIERYNWHVAYLALAGAMLFMTPFIVWTVRLAPWDKASAKVAAAVAVEGVSLKAAMRTRHFWIMAVAFSLQALGSLGLIGHFVPLLTDAGVDRISAAGTVGLIGLAIIVGRFCVGFLLDHVFGPWVAAAVALIGIAGPLGLLLVGVPFAPVTALCIGFSVGAEVDVIGYLASRYFGLKAYGRIYGVLYGAFLLGSGLSPFWMGEVFDRTGGYDKALIGCCAIMVVVIALVLTLPRYTRPSSGEQQEPQAIS